jgi:hypothetical protein
MREGAGARQRRGLASSRREKRVVRVKLSKAPPVLARPIWPSERGGEGMAANPFVNLSEPQAPAFSRSRFIAFKSIMLM